VGPEDFLPLSPRSEESSPDSPCHCQVVEIYGNGDARCHPALAAIYDDLDVETVYRPGRFHKNEDGFSRSPLVVECQRSGCICAQARENILGILEEEDDGEPDLRVPSSNRSSVYNSHQSGDEEWQEH
jgi:hypothetical protein